jgi:hypothetical protein
MIIRHYLQHTFNRYEASGGLCRFVVNADRD